MSKYLKEVFDLLCEEDKKYGVEYIKGKIHIANNCVKNNMMMFINKIAIKEVKKLEKFKNCTLISYHKSFYGFCSLKLYKDRWYIEVEDHEILHYKNNNLIHDIISGKDIKKVFESLDSKGIIKIEERNNDRRKERLFLDLSIDRIKTLITYYKLID